MTTCRCGTVLPSSCGFHPEGEECMCIGTMCDNCLADALGYPCAVHGCPEAPLLIIDGDCLCERHYREHWADK